MRHKYYFLISIMLIASLLTGCASTALAQASTPGEADNAQEPKQVFRTLTVTGSSKVYLTPDIAYINLGVHSEGLNAAETMADNNAQTAKILEAIKNFGIADKDIRTVNFSVYPQPQYNTEGQPTGEIRYSVDNTVYVTLRDLTKVGELLDAAVKAGANNVYGIQFDLSDKSKAMSEARKAAVENARAIAEELASAAGVTLGDVQTINMYGGSAPIVFEAKVEAAYAADRVPIQTGQLEINVEVNIIFEIR